jgi:tetratricopeptide (TPR) repeat protein
VLLSGEPGIGKSRLTSVLRDHMRLERHTLLRYSCSQHHRDIALYPFILQLENAADLQREDLAEQKLDKLEKLLAQSGPTNAGAIGLIANLLGLASGGRYPTGPPDPQRRRELTLAALIGQLDALACQRPMLMIFEDAQWADSTSLELLDRAVEHVAGLPALLIITFRPEFTAPWVGQAHVSSLSLSRLPHREIEAMVNGITAGKNLPAEVIECIVERTDGIPLFVEELTKSLLEGGLLREQNGAYVLDGPLPLLAIPSSLHGLLLARLDRLSQVKEIAQIGAAIGRKFSYELLAAVASYSEAELRAALERLTASGLVFCRGAPPLASYTFKHALVQDAAYSTLLRGQRQKLHARIAEALEQHLLTQQQISVGEHAALLADHWLRAENGERALTYTLEAAQRAEKLYSRPEAVGLYWQTLDLLERLPPTPDLNRVHAETISSLVRLPGWECDNQAKARLLRHVDRSLAHAVEAGELATVCRLEIVKGFQKEDELLFTSAVAHAEASGDAHVRAAAAFSYGMYLGGRAQYATSLDHISRAIEMMGDPGQRLEQGFMMIMGGRCFNARAGNLAESITYATRARGVAEELGDQRLRAWCAMEAEPYMYMGLWDKVIEVAEKWLPLAWEIHEWPAVFWSSAWLATAYLKLKRPDEAKQVLERLFSELPEHGLAGATYAVPHGHIAAAQLHLQTDQLDLALISARQAINSSQQARAPLEEGAAHRVLGQVYQAMNAHAEADAAFTRSLSILEKIQCPPELAQTLLAYGRFRRGDNAQNDLTLIERALSLFEEMGATGWIKEARAAASAWN